MTKPGDNDGRYRKAPAADNGGADRDADQRTIKTQLPTTTWRNIPVYTSPGDIPGAGRNKLFVDFMNSFIDKQLEDALLYGTSPAMLALSTSSFLENIRPPLKREAVTCGEIIGYRCWRVQDGYLRSVYQPDQWRPHQVIEGRGLEDWDTRGIHAWKGYSERFYYCLHEYMFASVVTGTVALWGDVVEHEHGYRAEFARVKSIDWFYPNLSTMGHEAEILSDLRQRYGV